MPGKRKQRQLVVAPKQRVWSLVSACGLCSMLLYFYRSTTTGAKAPPCQTSIHANDTLAPNKSVQDKNAARNILTRISGPNGGALFGPHDTPHNFCATAVSDVVRHTDCTTGSNPSTHATRECTMEYTHHHIPYVIVVDCLSRQLWCLKFCDSPKLGL